MLRTSALEAIIKRQIDGTMVDAVVRLRPGLS